jgi:hypothetical protein
MRWDELFCDLEAQLRAAEAAELAGEVADRSRRERATLSLVDRARGAVGHPVLVALTGVGPLAGVVLDVGSEWLLLRDTAGRDVLVTWASVVTITGIGVASAPPGEGGEVFRRLGLGSALRAVARDRSAVSIALVDGSIVAGTLDRVGRDFVEVSEHPVGEARRNAQVSAVRAIALTGIATVTRGG